MINVDVDMVLEVLEAKASYYRRTQHESPKVLIITVNAKEDLDYAVWKMTGDLQLAIDSMFGMKLRLGKVTGYSSPPTVLF